MSAAKLQAVYKRLLDTFGPQHWWPGETPFEVCVGAILTQNTNWANVERAVANLKQAGCLNPASLHQLSYEELARLIQPAGYFNVKSRRLKNFVAFLMTEYQGDLDLMCQRPLHSLREELLAVKGIGKETADSILLYAAGKAIFVVDTYTKRVLLRHEMVSEEADYDELQDYFMRHLQDDIALFNEYHALIVRIGKDYCKPKPHCEKCPLQEFLPRPLSLQG